MKSLWLKFLLLGTFALWATGMAKYAHEQLEHHGKDLSSVVNDDDDDDSSSQPPAQQQDQPKQHSHHCPVCEMLAGMTVDQSAPPALPPVSTECVATLVDLDRSAPVLEAHFSLPARGPPVIFQ
jgi:hypothetical protein